MTVGQWEAHVAPLDASTQPRIVRSGRSRGPAPPARRPTHPVRPVSVAIPTLIDEPAPTLGGRAAPTRTRVLPGEPPATVDPAPRRSRAWVGVLAAAVAAGLVTGGTLAALGVGVSVGSSSGGLVEATVRRGVQRLGTVSSGPQPVSVTFTVDASSDVPGFGDRVTYQAVGTDAATVDLSSVSASDVRLVGTRARVLIPAAQLATAVLDPSQSGEVSRKEGLATRILGTGIDPSDLQSEAVTRLGEQAQTDGVPTSAQRVAAADVQAVLRRLGVRTVIVAYAANS